MPKYLYYALGLIATAILSLLLLDVTCVALVKRSQGTSMYKMHRMFADHPADEIPIFGSSRAAANYAPSVLGPKYFNYGIDGSPMSETFFQLTNYLKLNPTGGPIVINLDPWGFCSGGFRADYTLSPVSPETRHDVIGIRMIGKLRGILAAWLNQRITGTKRIDSGAILQRVSRTSSEWAFIEKSLSNRGFSLTDEWWSRVEDLCSSSKRQLIWVVAPCSSQWRKVATGTSALRLLLADLRRQPNAVVIDLYDLKYGTELFMDADHLNEQGAMVFSKDLRNAMPPLTTR